MQPGKAPRRGDFYSANKHADLQAPPGATTAIFAAPWWAGGRPALRQWGPPGMRPQRPKTPKDPQGLTSAKAIGTPGPGKHLLRGPARGLSLCVGPPSPGPSSAIPWDSRQTVSPLCCETLSRKKGDPRKTAKRH